MAELRPGERLQPSLLDRLTDEQPDQKQESRERRVLSQQRLRQVVLRDLSWLLNTGNLAAVQRLGDYPLVASSTVNYGIPDLTGQSATNIDTVALERVMRQAVVDFEPRIGRDTIEVRYVNPDDPLHNNTLSFEIEGDLWGQPMPVRIFLRTDIDLESGDVKVSDRGGSGSG